MNSGAFRGLAIIDRETESTFSDKGQDVVTTSAVAARAWTRRFPLRVRRATIRVGSEVTLASRRKYFSCGYTFYAAAGRRRAPQLQSARREPNVSLHYKMVLRAHVMPIAIAAPTTPTCSTPGFDSVPSGPASGEGPRGNFNDGGQSGSMASSIRPNTVQREVPGCFGRGTLQVQSFLSTSYPESGRRETASTRPHNRSEARRAAEAMSMTRAVMRSLIHLALGPRRDH